MTKINSSGKQMANSTNGSSTQVTGHSTVVNNYSVNEDLGDFYRSWKSHSTLTPLGK